MTTDPQAATAFDRHARALHAAAIEQVPTRALHQLRMRRRAAAPAPARVPARIRGWSVATACAAVFAVAVGVRMVPSEAPVAVMAAAGAPSSATTAALADDPIDAVASLDEDPDFYLWLASSDAQLLALE